MVWYSHENNKSVSSSEIFQSLVLHGMENYDRAQLWKLLGTGDCWLSTSCSRQLPLKVIKITEFVFISMYMILKNKARHIIDNLRL